MGGSSNLVIQGGEKLPGFNSKKVLEAGTEPVMAAYVWEIHGNPWKK
jgi:hypothetical protein